MSPETTVTLLSCEHGGNRIPTRYAPLFTNRRTLAGHRGHDIGSLECARGLAAALQVPLIASTTSRLLVDLNRSPGHRALFSEFSRDLTDGERERIMARYYYPYRNAVEAAVRKQVDERGRAVHVSVHSFVPVLNGERRRADIGLLYDPGRKLERRLCEEWVHRIRSLVPGLTVRRNYPYRGTADGLTTWLRRRFAVHRYAGIELEINQRFALSGGRPWRELRRMLVTAFTATVSD